MNLPFIIGAAIVIEIFTLIFRLGFHWTSSKLQHKGHLPFRFHHMYFGVMVMFVGAFYSPAFIENFYWGIPGTVNLLDIGLAIFLSDVIHHFLILPVFHKDMDFPGHT